jgi:hypothetical protein
MYNSLVRLFGVLALIAALPLLASAVTATNTVSWTDLATETSYVLEISIGGTAYQPLVTLGANVTNYVDAGRALGQQYCYRVSGANTFGQDIPSTPACVTPGTPGQVIGVQVIATPVP